jgi:membrane protein DedA with SNARE-associated domain
MIISYPAGLMHMTWRWFLPATIIGSLAWAALATAVGMLAGPRVMALLGTLHTFEDWALAVAAGVVAAWWGWRRFGRRPHPTGSPEPDR